MSVCIPGCSLLFRIIVIAPEFKGSAFNALFFYNFVLNYFRNVD